MRFGNGDDSDASSNGTGNAAIPSGDASTTAPVSDAQLYSRLLQLQQQVQTSHRQLSARHARLAADETRLRQGVTPNLTAKDLEANLKRILPLGLIPGNVGDLNRIIWPFFYTTDLITLNPGNSVNSSFTVTQEAGFAWVHYIKTVYLKDERTSYMTYIDPEQPGLAGKAPGLSMIFRDSSSSRVFHNEPLNLDQVGSPRFPSALPSPQLFLPNANFQITFTNDHATNIYMPRVAFFGYRVRINDAQNILSMQFA